MLLEDFRTFLNDYRYEEDCEKLILTFSTGLETNKTNEANAGLYEIAQGNLGIESWMEKFGHRGHDEFDLSPKRWREQPEEVRAMANRLKDGINPAELNQKKVAQINDEIQRLNTKLSVKDSKNLKVVLFLGSNIGNMSDEVAADFIFRLGSNLRKGDRLLLGVDLIKPASIVLPAYNDSKGVTAEL